ncbi:MAG: hypothetical protein HY332_11220 [Chloroflexi bacterium]|nr:hypothetical protein [Chloroflexota bacterium]
MGALSEELTQVVVPGRRDVALGQPGGPRPADLPQDEQAGATRPQHLPVGRHDV